jgi:hypothetical protein
MNGVERQKLIALLGMTGSQFDGEAVTALRKAQQLMGQHKLTWQELLAPTSAASNGKLAQENYIISRENSQLRRELEQARRENDRLRQKPEQGDPGDHREQARWLLESD